MQGYRLFRNEGDSTSEDLNVEVLTGGFSTTDPSLRIFTVDLSSVTGADIGKIYKFKIRATNVNGFTESSALSVALASLPSKPSTIPVSVPSGTNQY